MAASVTESIAIQDSYDVVVIGGGPAGAALATFCQRAGHSCLVLERSLFPRYHIGESVIPQTYGTLERLGLLEALQASSYPKKYSVRFIPESGQDVEPFYFSETIEGPGSQTWQVERSTFDQLCLDNAAASGVEVRMRAGVRQVLFEEDRAVGVRIQNPGKDPQDIGARVVVDASGRSTVIGNQLGLKRPVPGLKKMSIWSYYKGGKRLQGIDEGETTAIIIPQRGWFWYIPLPADQVSVGVVASPEYLLREAGNFQEIFDREIELCAPVAERLRQAERVDSVRGIPELAYCNRQTAGTGWMMIGDAAAFLDPIYSSGLFLALASAEMAAQSVSDALSSDDLSADRLGAHAAMLMEGIEVIRRLIFAFYDPSFSFGGFVKRFPDQRSALIDCLVGDVVDKDMSTFLAALEQMTPVPPPLAW